MGNKAWCNLFPRHRVVHGSIAYFDYLSVILNIERGAQNRSNRLKPFRFESMWVGNFECKKIIKESWPHYSALDQDQNIMDYMQKLGIEQSLAIYKPNSRNYRHNYRDFKV